MSLCFKVIYKLVTVVVGIEFEFSAISVCTIIRKTILSGDGLSV